MTEYRSECYWAKSLTKGADAGRNDTALKRAGWARPGRSRVRSLAAAGFLLLLAALLALPMQAQAKTVTTDWGPVASGLGEGDWFRLVVVTSGTRNETVTNIAAYNTFVQNDVSTTGHTDTTSHSSSFKVLGCTSSTSAITNTSSSDTSAPINWLGGLKVSDAYADLYDNSWHSNVPTSGITSRTFTGCLDDGQNSQKFHLGEASQVTQGYPANQGFEVSGAGSPSGNPQNSYGLSGTRPMYGVSEVFQVGDASSDATLSGLALENASDDSGITLNEMFASTTTFYTADVANDVDKVTIKPTLSDSNAAYVFLDDSDAELTDSDTTKDNFQVALAEGLNTIKVKVTAENDMSIEIYTVVVTREPSTRVLVSNTGQDADGQQNTGSIGGFLTRNAQRFTTGSNTGGYTLEEVKISLTDVGANSVPVITINAGNGVNPGTVLYNLTNPTNLLSDTNIFTPLADATLSADTNYFVVMENSNTDNNNAGRYGVVLTSDNSEDNVGLSDWIIADIGRTGGNSWGNVSFSRAFKIRLSGTVEPSEPIPASTDATLSGLSVNDGTSDLTLTPGFVSDTYVYAADVGNAVEEVTLSATVNDDGAEVSGVTLGGTAIADTDFTDGITVPSLVVGDNMIVVTVTAEETSIILTYSITVTRATIAPGAPTDLTATAAGETRINLSWTAPTSDGGATISGYKVEVSLTGTSDWSDLVANTGATDTTYSHTGLSAGNTRHYRVKAINSAGTGSASDVAGATTAAVNVLVSNTGQTVDPRLLSAIGSRNKTYSQGFETGTNPGGYSLAAVGVYVYVETLGTGETFTVHIYTANSAGAPDTLAYTLTSPASYADGAVNTFTAPAGATLDADTDYLVVFEGTADASLDFILGLTSSDEQDRGSRSGWEIEDTNRYQGLMQTAGNSYQISVNGSAIPTDVPSTWALKPAGLTAGDTFRLLFLSSTKRDASSTDIADYNTFIQTTAAAGHTAIQKYSSSFTAVGCTSSTDAHDNTDTTGAGVPIYWLGGDKVADDYEDFYDGTWDNESDSHDRNEDSSNGTITSISANYPWTGCGHDGTEGFNAGVIPRSLGNDEVRLGAPGNSSSAGPINGDTADTSSSTRPMYGLSPVFKVIAASSDATLSGLVLTDASSNAITLTPTFVATTKSYTASVTNDDDEITIVPTVNDSSANYEIQDGDGNVLTDSDSNVGDLQVDLDVGDNTIKVEVTAEDTTTTETYQVVITRTMAATATEVPASWSLKPTGLGAGDEFRLIFLSSTKRNANSTNIANYNTFIQNLATAGHAAIQTYNSGFKVVGCTQDTDARDNTNTTGTGVPIYWLNGAKIAAAYADFYDGEWDDEANPKNESGTDGPDTSDSVNYPFTGCEDDGTEASNRALGNSGNVLVGRPNSSTSGHGPIGSDSGASSTLTRPMYGVSEVFQVGDASSDATLSGLTLENASDDSGVTLNEMFASTTTFYTADVANDVDKVTIKPTLSASNAAYVFLDDSNAELTDSDTTKDNFQVALAEGLNTLKVKVTAENDMSIEIYTVVVTREPSTRVLVSNTGQDADGQQSTGSIGGFLTRNAQRFTTGSNTGGYTLEEVKISLTDVGANSVPVITINAGIGVNPGTVLYNLTNPANLSSDTNTFTPPADATLSADTNYFVVMENSNTDNNNAGRYGVVLTSDNSEDNVGLSDWIIADIGRSGGNSWGNVSSDRAFKIRLSGTVEPSEPIPASTDATLSGLSVNDGTSDLTLTPGFVSDTYVYAADVGNAVEEVTLSATVNDDGAEVSGVTLDGTAVADTDFTDGITVPSLVVGDNVIVVTVAAEETSIILTYSITVTRGPVPTEVPSTWSLRPSRLSTGDEFRLLFLSSERINGSLVNISAYNTLIQGYIGLSHAAIQEFSSGFTAVGCTEDTDARDNTATTGTGIPIYWLGGSKVAADYWHFYDGDWDDEANPKNELGANGLNTSLSANHPWTGCGHDGREDFDGTTSLALGKDFVRVGRPDSSTSGHGPLSSDASVQKDNTRPMYGLSPVFKMAAATDATLGGLSVNDGMSDLTLTPGFVSGTYVYAADVGNAVEEVTLSATVNDDGAEVSGVTLGGTAVADTDFTDGITVPSLVVGDNVIVVTVAAEETSIILTYSITVTRATIAPGAPTDLTATAAGETRINLSWTAPTSDGGATISGYKVEVSLTDTSGWSDLVANTGATDTTYSHTGLSAGNTRHYRVKAINSAGTGSASDVAGATTAAVNVLVSNTGQTVDPRLLSAIGSRNKTYSQGFETGTNPGGYSLAAVGVYVYVETLGTGETFTVHIYTVNSAGAPDILAYTLTSPASYADGAVNTFTAPAGATLDADTDYFVVFEGTADASLDFILGLTSSDEQDRGSRSGWEIEDTNRYQGLMQTAGNSYQISVNGSAVPTDVPSTWALKPTGLTAGDTFRLLFLSSTKRDASSTDIADYNTFIQTTADAGHTAIQGYGDGFRVVGCTGSVDARDNTLTIYTTSDKGVPIYWLSGAKAADDYEDFYDGDWDEEANDKNESGTDGPDTSQLANYPWTGCNHDGTEEFDSLGGSEALGRSLVSIGRPNDSTAGNGPLDSSAVATSSNTRPFYGLSEIFQVVAGSASTDATLSALTVNVGTNDLSLDPTFAYGTYIYVVEVGNAVDEVTLTATVNHSGAEVSGVTLGGTVIADADFTDGITVPWLIVGDNEIVVTVTAADDATTQAHTVTVTRAAANSAPTFPTTTADREVAENTAAGQNVGGTFTATDSDSDPITYTLEGTDAASFNLITASGSAQIRTKTGVTYNHEVKSTYTVVVKADDSNGGTDTITVTITVTDVNEPPARPAAPNVSAAGSATSLNVTWNVPTNTGPDIDNYDLQYRQGTSGSFTNGPQNVIGITDTIPNLSANTSYQVQVRATNDEGDSPWSPSGTGSTGSLPVTPPGKVTGVNITPGDRTLRVNWAQVSGATGYKVQWKSGGQSYNSSSRQATISSGSTTSRTISSLNNGTEYTVRVIATKTGASDGTPSDDVNATPTADITAPGAPRGLNATAVGNTRINLSWNAPDSDGGSPITGYKIEVSSNGNSWTTRVANTGSANRTYSHTGLSTGDTRHYRVSAINSSGTGPTSNVARATTGLPVVSIASASTTEGQDIVFTVTISPPISGFRRLSYGTGSDSIPSGSKAATAGNDYVTPHTASKVIQIGYGLTSVEIRFRTIDDDLVEGTEVFGIGLHGSSDEGREYSVGTRTVIGTIRDNDNNGQRYVDTVRGNSSTSASISVGGSVPGRIEEVSDADWYRTSLTAGHCYRIGVAGSSDSDSLTLPYPALYGVYRTDSTRISGTSARADYGGNKAISHVKLDTSGTYYISVGIHRFLGEGTYRLSLSDLGTSSTACGAAKAGAIAGPLEISVADASKREWPNPQAYLVFDVTLDRDADREVRVNYATVNGTAVAGQDYESQSGTLVFGTGEDSKRIWVPIEFDREDEETETMTLRLSNAVGGQIRRDVATGSIYDYSTSR